MKQLREIKNRWTGAVIHSGETNTIKELVLDAIAKKVNLSGSDLSYSNLSGSNLSYSNLSYSNLSGSNLSYSNLSGSDLSGSDLSGSDLSGVPSIPNIHGSVFAAASASPDALDMSTWHTCETTHCRAGWVIQLAGDAGRAMEFCIGTPAAAALIYIKSDPKLERVPNFYASDETALEDMKRLAEEEAKAVNV